VYAGAIILVGVIFRRILNDDKHIAARKRFTGFIVGYNWVLCIRIRSELVQLELYEVHSLFWLNQCCGSGFGRIDIILADLYPLQQNVQLTEFFSPKFSIYFPNYEKCDTDDTDLKYLTMQTRHCCK
jgi:hypothetical protein